MSKMRNQIRKRKTNTGLGKTGVLKRGLALLLAVLMTESVTVNAGISYVKAQEVSALQAEAESLKAAESESGAESVLQGYRILSFGELPEEIQVQTLPVGAKETDIEFPDQLTVTAKELLTSNVEDGMEEDDSLEDSEKAEPSGEDAEKEDTEKEDTEKEDINKEDAEKEASKEEDSKEEGTSGENTEKETGEKEDASEGESAGEEQGQKEEVKEEPGNEQNNNSVESGNIQESGTENTGEPIINQTAAAWEQFIDAFRPMTVYAAELEGSDPANGEEDNENVTEGETVELTLTGIEWKLDPAESDFSVFDGKKKGSVYTYTPVLPEVSDDGTPIILHENAELPVICVLVGEMQISLLAGGGTYELDDLPFKSDNNVWNVVIDQSNKAQFDNAVLTGGFSAFTDTNGNTQKSSWKGIVIDGVEVNLTIKDVTINRNKSEEDNLVTPDDAAITLRNGATLNLTLEGENYLEGSAGGAGICVEEGCTLRITQKSTGKLKAVGGNYYGGAAGIGANSCGWSFNTEEGTEQKLGTIVIEGGTIEAVGGWMNSLRGALFAAAGIGGSEWCTTGKIEITGGSVTATGGVGAAGIGGGYNGRVPDILISGGIITATSSLKPTSSERLGAAIGTGYLSQVSGEVNCGNIRITGGTIVASGNIGYGAINPANTTPSRSGSVEVGKDVTLSFVDGVIDPSPSGEGTTEYDLTFTIYDGRLAETTKADLSMGETKLAQSVTATVSTPGTAVIKTRMVSGTLTGKRSVQITMDGRKYDAEVDFQTGKTLYDITVGTKLYPVTLEFYDPAITQDMKVNGIVVKKNGKALDKTGYYAPDQITMQQTHYGTMVLYLPEGTSDTEISVTVDSLNQGNAITKSQQSISSTATNTIRMLDPVITLKAEQLAVNEGNATLKVTSNYAGITLWYLKQNTENEPDSSEVKEKGTRQNFKETSGEITVPCESAAENRVYLVAELGGVTSDVFKFSFSSDPAVELIEKGQTKGFVYDSLKTAIQAAPSYPGCTIKLLKNLTLEVAWNNGITFGAGDCTIDLNGKTITMDKTDKVPYASLTIPSGGTVTWMDSSSGKKGIVTGNMEDQCLFSVVDGGTLVIQGGTFRADAGDLGGNNVYGKIRIEGGEFYNNINIISQNPSNYSEVLSGGVFHGTIKVVWGSTAGILKRGHYYKSLEEPGDISTGTTDVEGSISNVQVIARPRLEGTLQLSTTECEWGQNITATYTPESSQTGETENQYVYKWYMVKDGKVEKLMLSLNQYEELTANHQSTYYVRAEAVGAEIYCEVEEEGTKYSGAIRSEKAKILAKDINGVTTTGKSRITFGKITKDFTGKEVTLTAEDIKKGSIDNSQIVLGRDVEIDENTYKLNIWPNNSASATVKIRGIGNYRGEYTVTFKIVKKDISAVATVSPNDWTNQSVTVFAPAGYTICPKTENGYDYENGFTDSFIVSEESSSEEGTPISYCLKEDPVTENTDGAISAEKTVQVKIDRSAPDFDGEGDGIKVENNIWKRLLNKITFGTYTRTKDVTIQATDAISGVAEYYYYVDTVTDKKNYQILSIDTLNGYAETGKFESDADGKFSLSDKENQDQVVYAYAVDRAGNRSDYICTEGLVLDTKEPVMTITEPKLEDGTLKDTEVTITVELDEDAAILFFYQSMSYLGNNSEKYKRYVDAVNEYMDSEPRYRQFLKTVNGKQVPTVVPGDNDTYIYGVNGRYQYHMAQLQVMDKKYNDIAQNCSLFVFRMEGKKGKNNIIVDADDVNGLDPDTDHTIWIAAVDPAGNITVQQIEFKTAKAMPTIAEPPVVSGVYGDMAQDLKVTPGVARYGDKEITGSWNITDTGTTPLPMDGTAQCKVTFIPDESYNDKYEQVVFEVTPTLAKRPVEVVIRSMGKTYGMQMPLLSEYAIINKVTQNGKENGLVTPDDKQSLLESLRWVTDATKDSPAGQYEYTVTSDSPKYEVTAVYYDPSTGYDELKGTLTITKATGVLATTADFKDVQSVRYQGGDKAAFRLGVQANHNETPLHYQVTNAVDGNGNPIAPENISSQLLTIAPDGTVTPKGVGSAAITVSLPECNNYTAAEDTMTVQVNIAKGDVVPSQVETAGTLTYGEPLSRLGFAKAVFVDADDNSVTIPGTIEWIAPATIPAAGNYEAEYRFKPYDASDSSWENNYNPYEGKVTVTVNKAKARLVDVPVPGEVIYNPNLSLSVWLLNESAKEHGHVEDIEGKWIQGSWKFKDPDVEYTALQKIGVGTKSYEIYFEPNLNQAYGGNPDYANYDFSDITATVNITVKKAVPYISVQPTVKAYTHGDYLYNQNLSEGTVIIGNGKGESGSGSSETKIQIPGTFTWKTPSTQLSHVGSNRQEYEYVFTPDDTTCYEIATGKITITVNKAQYPPLMPGSRRNVARSCAKVSDVELPQGWEWDEADSKKELTVGTAVTAKAIYTAADSANYENGSVSIEITRADCEHTKTEIRKAVKATCMSTGGTGETWCLICKKQLSDGDVIPKDVTNHTELTKTVIRQATTSTEGLLLQECKDCGYSKEVTIPKLPGGNSGGSTGGNDDQQSGGQSDGQNENQGSGSSSSASSEGTTATPTPSAGGKAQTSAPAPTSSPVSEPASKPASTPAPANNNNGNKEPKEPFIKGENGKKGWQVIESQTDGAKEGETIHVDMNGVTTVPGAIFDSIRGRDITVTFDLGGGILWTVNGLDVAAQNAKDIDFGVTMGELAGSSIPVDVINNVTGERYSMNLTLAYDGEFGFTATLTINMDAVNAGLYANLFYYNPETGELEFMCAGKIDEAGNTELTFSHASDYTIVIDTMPMDGSVQDETGAETGMEQDETMDEPDDTGAAPSGQTADEATDGDSGNVFSNGIFWILIGAAIVVVIAAIGAVYVLCRKKEDQRMEEQK